MAEPCEDRLSLRKTQERDSSHEAMIIVVSGTSWSAGSSLRAPMISAAPAAARRDSHTPTGVSPDRMASTPSA
jgi:hypothetical protein